jgi:hypothetical protein
MHKSHGNLLNTDSSGENPDGSIPLEGLILSVGIPFVFLVCFVVISLKLRPAERAPDLIERRTRRKAAEAFVSSSRSKSPMSTALF